MLPLAYPHRLTSRNHLCTNIVPDTLKNVLSLIITATFQKLFWMEIHDGGVHTVPASFHEQIKIASKL